MKRLFTAALSAALLLSLALPSSAAGTGRAVDWALYTDITAQINGHPLRSYNVNGSTAVVAEDLRGYGFQVLWDAEDRTLSVERAADSTGCPALPASWPDYTPPALTQPVGTRAQPILSTDIDTYVAGQYVRSCNIGGETLICFSDLAPYGAVSFDEDSRTAELTLGDPMQIQLDDLIQRMEDVKEFINVEYQLYPSASGTLFAGSMGGVPHGSSFQLYFVRNNGTKLDIISLLPAYMGGSHSFARYRDIELDDAGTVLTFISPVKETINWATGETKDWGDTLCTIDLVSGTMRSMHPLSQTLAQWSAYYEAETWPEGFLPPTPPLSDGSVSLTLSRPEGTAEVVCLDGSLPTSCPSPSARTASPLSMSRGCSVKTFSAPPMGSFIRSCWTWNSPPSFKMILIWRHRRSRWLRPLSGSRPPRMGSPFQAISGGAAAMDTGIWSLTLISLSLWRTETFLPFIWVCRNDRPLLPTKQKRAARWAARFVFYPRATASATRMPSTAAETIPPA